MVRVPLAALIVAFVAGTAHPVSCVPNTQLGGHGGWTDGARVELADVLCYSLARPSNVYFAAAVFTLSHEAEHLRGVTDEHAADCAALRVMSSVLRRFWPRLGIIWRATILAQARALHAAQPPPYAGGC